MIVAMSLQHNNTSRGWLQALEIGEVLENRDLQRLLRQSRQRCNNQLLALNEDRQLLWHLMLQTRPEITNPRQVLLL